MTYCFCINRLHDMASIMGLTTNSLLKFSRLFVEQICQPTTETWSFTSWRLLLVNVSVVISPIDANSVGTHCIRNLSLQLRSSSEYCPCGTMYILTFRDVPAGTMPTVGRTMYLLTALVFTLNATFLPSVSVFRRLSVCLSSVFETKTYSSWVGEIWSRSVPSMVTFGGVRPKDINS